MTQRRHKKTTVNSLNKPQLISLAALSSLFALSQLPAKAQAVDPSTVATPTPVAPTIDPSASATASTASATSAPVPVIAPAPVVDAVSATQTIAHPAATVTQTVTTATQTPVIDTSAQMAAATAAATAPKIVNIDLGSATQNLNMGNMLNTASLQINVGGTTRDITSASALTAAEKVAAFQVMNTGAQSLILNNHGIATGGTMTINPWLSNHLGNLSIPTGVTVLGSGTVNLQGDLMSSGSLLIGAQNAAATGVSLNANNISLNSTGMISNILPSANLMGANSPSLNLSLSAINNILNQGSIFSSGALSLTAGGSVMNVMQAGTGFTPVMQAMNDINMASGAGSIMNTGLIASTQGNINMAAAQSLASLNVMSQAGTFQALNGNINVMAALNNGTGNINLMGGDWMSRQLNLDTAYGTVNANLSEVTGQVNVTGSEAHILASTPNLNLGNITLSGDPTFYNTGGSVTLSGATTVGGDLAIIASQDVITNNLTTTDGGDATNNGDITLIAGANFTSGQPAGQVGPDTTTTLTINGGSATGGSVQVTGNIATPTTSATGTPGNIVVVAYTGSGVGSTFTPGSINITGSTTSNRGSITMVGGATTGAAITTGSITSSGTNGGTSAGAINLYAAAPVINGASISVLNGVTTPSAPFLTTGLTINGATISTGDIISAGAGGAGSNSSAGSAGGSGGAITINGGSGVSTGALRSFGGGGGGGGYSAGIGGAGGSGALIDVRSSGAISINGDINSSGGGGGGSGASSSNAAGGSAGNINVVGTSTVTISGPVLAASGGFGGRSGDTLGGAGGGGSFGGAGGGGAGALFYAGGAGGGGFTGGGGAGGGANTNGGGGGGGGGWAAGGGGGGGAGGVGVGGQNQGAGGGGGGGIGYGGGGGGSGATAAAPGGGAAGGAGGGNGSGGSSGGFGGGTGQTSSAGGGTGANGFIGPGAGGSGGVGGTTGAGTGGGGGSVYNGGTGGAFGAGGTGTSGSGGAAQTGGAAGTSGNGGDIVISGVGTVQVTNTILGLGTALGTSGFSGLTYSGDSINAMGNSGTINVSVTAPTFNPTYFQDANYASGASTYLAPTGGLSIAGNLRTTTNDTITINGTLQSGVSVVNGPISSGGTSQNITISGVSRTINGSSMVTPAEWLAFVQVATTGLQPLTLSGTTVGTGFASAGNFSIAAINVPSSNFSNLNLPASVTANSSVNLTYTGSAIVNGTLNTTGSALNVGSTTAIGASGAINFQSATTNTLTSGGTISSAGGPVFSVGTLNLAVTNGSIFGTSSANPLSVNALTVSAIAGGTNNAVRLSTSGGVTLNASSAGTGGVFSLVNNTSGNIGLAGDINSSASPTNAIVLDNEAPGGNIFTTVTPRTLNASAGVSLISVGGQIGTNANPIRVNTPSFSVGGTPTEAHIRSEQSATLSSSTASTITEVTQAGAGSLLTAGNITSATTTLQALATSNASINVNAAINSGASGTVNLTADGTGTLSGTGLITANQVNLKTGGGNIATSLNPMNLSAPNLNVQTNSAGTAFVTDNQSVIVTSGTGTAGTVGNLTVRETLNNGRISVGTAGLNFADGVTLQAGTGTNANINLEGNMTWNLTGTNGTVNLTTNGTGVITESALGTGTGRILAGTLNATTGGGNIGASGNELLVQGGTLNFQTNSTGNVFISSNSGSIITTGTGATGSVGDLTYTQTFGGGVRDVLGRGSSQTINATGNIVVQQTGAGQHDLDIEGNVTTANNRSITLNTSGGGVIDENLLGFGTGRLTAGTVNLNTTGGGRIGASGNPVLLSAANVNVQTGNTGTGNVFISNNVTNSLSTAGTSIGSLTATQTGSGTTMNITPTGINANGTVTLNTSAGSNANINFDGNVNAGANQISVTTEGTGIITENGLGLGTGTLTGSQVNITTGGGNYGSGGLPILTNTPILFVQSNSAGSGFINDSQTASITTGTGATGSVGNLTVTETTTNTTLNVGTAGITATGNVTLQGVTGNNNSINFEGNVTQSGGGDITIRAFGTGTITENALGLGTGTLTGGNVYLLTNGGQIGALGQEVLVSSGTVRMNSNGTGDAFVNTDISTRFDTFGGSLRNVTLTQTGGGNVLTAGIITATGNVTLQGTTGSNALLNIAGDVTAGGASSTITMTTSGALGYIAENATGTGTGTLFANQVNFTTEGGNVGASGNPMLVSTPKVVAQTNGTGNVYISNAISGQVLTSDTTPGVGSVNQLQYVVTANNGTATIGQLGIVANGNVLIEATGGGGSGNISIGSTVNAGSNAITLRTGGTSGNITNAIGVTPTLTAGQVNVESTGAGLIGGVGSPITINSPILVVSTNGTGDAYFSDSQSVTVTSGSGTAGAIDRLTVTQTGSGANITVGAAGIGVNGSGVGANQIVLQGATGSNANIVINGNIQNPSGGNYTGTTILTVEGSGTITDPTGAGRILSSNVSLNTAGGDIGTASNPLLISSDLVDVLTNGAGNAYISNNLTNFQTLSTPGGGTVGSLTYTATSGTIRLGSASDGITGTGNLVFQGTTGTPIPIIISNNVSTGNSNSITIHSTGSGTISTSSATNLLTAGTVNLTADNAGIGAAGVGRILTNTPTLVVSTGTTGTGAVFVGDSQSVNLTTPTGQGVGSLDFTTTTAGTTVTVGTSGITSGGSVNLESVGLDMNIVLTGGITAPNVNLAIVNASGSISGLGQVQASTGVTLRNDNGNIGASGAALNLSTPNYAANAGGGVGAGPSSVYLNNDQIATLGTSSATSVFQVNNPADLTIAGDLTVNNATTGGAIQIFNTGSVNVNGNVRANGTTGTGGTILFSNQAAGNPLTVNVSNNIQATNTANTSGRVAFNGGATGNVTVTGAGTVSAGEFVGFGDVNTTTLAVNGGQVIPTTNAFTSGLNSVITVALGGNILNQIMSTQAPPPVPPVVVGGGTTGGGGRGGILTLAELSALLAAQQNAQLNAIIGTRTATDFTPIDASNLQQALYTIRHEDNPKLLQGKIEIDKRDIASLQSALFHGASFSDEQLEALRNAGVVFGPNTGGAFFNLDKGYVVFAPTQDITVQTHEGNVHIAAGSTVYVMETGNDVAVYNLHDSRKGGVQIVSNNRLLTVQPGTQVLLTRNPNAHFDHLNPGKDIGHRKAHNRDLGGGITAHISEFSIIGAFSSVPALRDMIKSDNKAQRHLAHKMIKNAVILMALNPKGLPYKASGASSPQN